MRTPDEWRSSEGTMVPEPKMVIFMGRVCGLTNGANKNL
jgi:hypothetical protein